MLLLYYRVNFYYRNKRMWIMLQLFYLLLYANPCIRNVSKPLDCAFVVFLLWLNDHYDVTLCCSHECLFTLPLKQCTNETRFIEMVFKHWIIIFFEDIVSQLRWFIYLWKKKNALICNNNLKSSKIKLAELPIINWCCLPNVNSLKLSLPCLSVSRVLRDIHSWYVKKSIVYVFLNF